MTHICVGKLTITGSENGLSPGRRQAIIWTNAGILLIRHRGTNFSDIVIAIQTVSFMKMHLNVSSAKWRPFCFGLNVLIKKLWFRQCSGNTWTNNNKWCPNSINNLCEHASMSWFMVIVYWCNALIYRRNISVLHKRKYKHTKAYSTNLNGG